MSWIGLTCVDWTVADFNGDGLDDLGTSLPENRGFAVALSSGLAFGPVETWTTQQLRGSGGWDVGDFDGDGSADLIRRRNTDGGLVVHFSNGSGFDEGVSIASPWTAPFAGALLVGDFDGDGRDDIAHQGTIKKKVFGVSVETPGPVEVVRSAGRNQVSARSVWTDSQPLSDGWVVDDFNGDGQDDLGRSINRHGGLDVLVSNGSSFGLPQRYSAAGFRGHRFYSVTSMELASRS